MSVDKYIDQSYQNYLGATEKFSVAPVDKKEYRDLLFSAATALKDVQDTAYVIVKIEDLYMKTKKLGENLEISYMDRETFNLTTKFKEEQTKGA
jgi:hypothetical protein